MTRRLNILLSAYACRPDSGSEPGVGWNWVQQLAPHHNLWVITSTGGQAMIEAALRACPLPSVRWHFVDLPEPSPVLKRNRLTLRVYYYLWQMAIYRLAKRLTREVRFDLAHHVSYCSYWTPSFLALLPVPFVWGPVGGAENAPGALYDTLPPGARMQEYVRSVVRGLATLDPFVHLTARRSASAFASTPQTAARLRALGAKRVEVLIDAALSGEDFALLSALPARTAQPFRLISVGRLLAMKGYHLSLQAFARLQNALPDAEYWIIGDGPDRARLEALAARLGIANRVRFCGRLERAEVLRLMAECDALVHPSLYEASGWVCLEAMAAGRPVIALDIDGLAVELSDETSLRVPADNAETVLTGLADAMLKLARDPALRARMGEVGRARVCENFLWESKFSEMQKCYDRVVAQAALA